ncbi:SNARE domain-containing protein [Tautonia sociabilis]|uniref:Periplasmic heavy metal sensor n=1 Tax=Tautonia sociabilis TaxID=2080755 RepID=A0A432MCL1_9BACT|nr:hypothetical protein [Tautonia sociabilis]RUL81239.1 hypothetical protein TsocGM_25435 [Tautonia sociabilis]
MLNSLRATAIALALVGSSIALGYSAGAQDDSKPPGTVDRPAQEGTPSKTYPPYRRLPTYFGLVGVSDQQKQDIYAIRGRYREEIAALEQRIQELKRQELSECEAVLTEAQQKLLNQIRAARGGRSDSSGN